MVHEPEAPGPQYVRVGVGMLFSATGAPTGRVVFTRDGEIAGVLTVDAPEAALLQLRPVVGLLSRRLGPDVQVRLMRVSGQSERSERNAGDDEQNTNLRGVEASRDPARRSYEYLLLETLSDPAGLLCGGDGGKKKEHTPVAEGESAGGKDNKEQTPGEGESAPRPLLVHAVSDAGLTPSAHARQLDLCVAAARAVHLGR
eukprot:8225684-Pyramimonas_sp.AAC.1